MAYTKEHVISYAGSPSGDRVGTGVYKCDENITDLFTAVNEIDETLDEVSEGLTAGLARLDLAEGNITSLTASLTASMAEIVGLPYLEANYSAKTAVKGTVRPLVGTDIDGNLSASPYELNDSVYGPTTLWSSSKIYSGWEEIMGTRVPYDYFGNIPCGSATVQEGSIGSFLIGVHYGPGGANCALSSGEGNIVIGLAHVLTVDPIFNGYDPADPEYTADTEYHTIGSACTGNVSIAHGELSIASGVGSIALGNLRRTSADPEYIDPFSLGATASGNGSIAIGTSVEASGRSSVAIGGRAFIPANPRTDPPLINQPKTVASGTNAFAIGSGCVASGSNSFALGFYSRATAERSFAMGYSCLASAPNAFAQGTRNTTSGESSFSAGADNTVSHLYSQGMGYKNTVSGRFATAIGRSNTVSGEDAKAIGRSNTASGVGSIACGYSNTSSGEGSICIGTSNDADELANCFIEGTSQKPRFKISTGSLNGNGFFKCTGNGYCNKIGDAGFYQFFLTAKKTEASAGVITLAFPTIEWVGDMPDAFSLSGRIRLSFVSKDETTGTKYASGLDYNSKHGFLLQKTDGSISGGFTGGEAALASIDLIDTGYLYFKFVSPNKLAATIDAWTLLPSNIVTTSASICIEFNYVEL